MLNEELQSAFSQITPSAHLVVIAVAGGLVLWALKIAEHFMRAEQDKMPLAKYLFFVISLFVGLPFLGGFVTSVYIMNGDKLSPILALQVGLTSPAVVQSLIIAAANSLAKKGGTDTRPGQ